MVSLAMGFRYRDEVIEKLLEGVQAVKESTTCQKILRDGKCVRRGRLIVNIRELEVCEDCGCPSRVWIVRATPLQSGNGPIISPRNEDFADDPASPSRPPFMKSGVFEKNTDNCHGAAMNMNTSGETAAT